MVLFAYIKIINIFVAGFEFPVGYVTKDDYSLRS